jgi:hypothetical protein
MIDATVLQHQGEAHSTSEQRLLDNCFRGCKPQGSEYRVCVGITRVTPDRDRHLSVRSARAGVP